MRLPQRILQGVALALLAIPVLGADYEHEYVEDGIVEDLTFGAHGAIWAKDHRHIAGWTISGEGYNPELLSDRIILTPPYPGNKRGAIWAQHPETHEEWEAEFEFRATGPDRGSGLMQMWYARNPTNDIGKASLYTVGKFDGLVLAIGQYGGQGGSLRGFLNDGTVSFKDHHHVDQMAFASCDLHYRNTGHFMHVKVKQTHYTFEVEIDNKPCFTTHKIHLPHGYYFGLTAASAETPDSFETKSFIVHKLKEGKRIQEHGHGKHPDEHHEQTYEEEHAQWVNEVQEHFHNDAAASSGEHHAAAEHHSDNHEYHEDDRGWYWTTEKETPKDEPASHFKTDESRFQDLHSRISVLNHQLDILFHDLSTFKRESEERHENLMHFLRPLHSHSEHLKQVVEKLEGDVHAVRADVEGKDYREHLEQLHAAVEQGHQAVIMGVPHAVNSVVQAASPRMGFFVFLMFCGQCMLLASYIVYRRRRDAAPKKYL